MELNLNGYTILSAIDTVFFFINTNPHFNTCTIYSLHFYTNVCIQFFAFKFDYKRDNAFVFILVSSISDKDWFDNEVVNSLMRISDSDFTIIVLSLFQQRCDAILTFVQVVLLLSSIDLYLFPFLSFTFPLNCRFFCLSFLISHSRCYFFDLSVSKG